MPITAKALTDFQNLSDEAKAIVMRDYPVYRDFGALSTEGQAEAIAALSGGTTDEPELQIVDLAAMRRDAAIPVPQEGFSIGKTLTNVPSSAKAYVGDIATAIMHPYETAKALGNVALGGAQKLIPGEQADEQAFDALTTFFKDRYGSTDAILNTIQTDPVGFLGDLSTAFTGIGGGVRLVGKTATKAGKVGVIATAGEKAATVGKAIDPINLGISILGKPVKGAGALGAEMLGVTTGAGAHSVKEAIRGKRDFLRAMRGEISGDDIVGSARDGINVIKEQRASEYLSKLDSISKVKTKLNLQPLYQALDDNLKKFHIKRTADGELDFRGSVIRTNPTAQNEVKKLVEAVTGQAGLPDGLTPTSIDILKRALGEVYSESSSVRAMTQDLTNTTKKILVNNVANYSDMVKSYEKTSRLLDEMGFSLSLGKKQKPEQTLAKLTRALKEDADFKRDFIKILDGVSGGDIQAKIAGHNMRQVIPSGTIGKFFGAGELYALSVFHPTLIPIMIANSPRAIGEFIFALRGPVKGAKMAKEAIKKTTVPRQIAGQFGRVERVTERPEGGRYP